MNNKNYTAININDFNTEYAGFLRRLFAYILDLIFFIMIVPILILYLSVILFFFNILIDKNNLSEIQALLLGNGLYISYFVFFLSLFSTTPGKYLLNMIVLTENNKKLSFINSLIRSLIQPISTLLFGIGYTRMINDPKKQAWHDKIAKTVVIISPKHKNIFKVIFFYLLFYFLLFTVLTLLILIKNIYFK